MPPVMQKALDVAIAIALTAALVLVITSANGLLMLRGGAWTGFRH